MFVSTWAQLTQPTRINICSRRHAPQRLPDSLFGWILPLIRIPHAEVLEKVGLDAVVVCTKISETATSYLR